MALVAKFTFNPFQENTYIVYDETKECIIFDPGMYTEAERKHFAEFIESAELRPVRLINTHCHLDHVFGNKFVADTYQLGLEIHEGEVPVLESFTQVCAMYGVPNVETSPAPSRFIKEGDTITFGNTSLAVLFTPGHSPASISFFCKEDQFLIAGDVLFRESIGRTDLPGGDMKTLLDSIRDKCFPLGDDVRVHSGHGEDTTIGFEKANNPFLNGAY